MKRNHSSRRMRSHTGCHRKRCCRRYLIEPLEKRWLFALSTEFVPLDNAFTEVPRVDRYSGAYPEFQFMDVGTMDNRAPRRISITPKQNTEREGGRPLTDLLVAEIDFIDDPFAKDVAVSLSGPDTRYFQLVGNQLLLSSGSSLDFESKSSYDVYIDVDDPTVGESPDYRSTFSFTVIDVNEPPTNFTFQNRVDSIPELTDVASGLVVADLSAEDDALGTNEYALSGVDAAWFRVSNHQLIFQTPLTLDFEAKSNYRVTVQLKDPTFVDASDIRQDFSLQIINVNEAPTNLRFVNRIGSIAESNQSNLEIVVARIQVNDDALGTNIYSLTGPDASSFVIQNQQLVFRSSSPLNFETKSSYLVTVQADDPLVGGSPDLSQDFQLRVDDVNELPTGFALTNRIESLMEGSDLSQGLIVATVQFTDDALGNNLLSLSGSDAEFFSIQNGQLILRSQGVLDFEFKSTYQVNVNLDDPAIGSNPDLVQSFQLLVNDTNEAPTHFTLIDTLPSFAESTDSTTGIVVAKLQITDDALGTNQYTLDGPDGSHFSIQGDRLIFRSVSALDFETKSSYLVNVRLDDPTIGNGPEFSIPFSVGIIDQPEVTAVTDENGAPLGTLVDSILIPRSSCSRMRFS